MDQAHDRLNTRELVTVALPHSQPSSPRYNVNQPSHKLADITRSSAAAEIAYDADGDDFSVNDVHSALTLGETGSRWICFGVRVPRTLDYPTINSHPR